MCSFKRIAFVQTPTPDTSKLTFTVLLSVCLFPVYVHFPFRRRCCNGTLSFLCVGKYPTRYIQRNSSLRKGLEAVVGLNFAALPAQLQLKMMKGMEITRYSKVRNLCRVTNGVAALSLFSAVTMSYDMCKLILELLFEDRGSNSNRTLTLQRNALEVSLVSVETNVCQ